MFIIFRAISIEFRGKEEMLWWKKTWDIGYSVSSIMLAFLLGVVLGNILQGISFGENYYYFGDGFFEFLNPFAILTGFTALFLFMAHGASFLLLKTEGKMFDKLTLLLKRGIALFIISYALTTLYVFFFIPHLSNAFISNPILLIVPLLTFLSVANLPRLASKRQYKMTFLFSSITISLLLIVVAIELYPILLLSTIDPKYNIDIYNAASSEKSLGIMLMFVVIGTPLILGYTFFVYKTFWGKVQLDETSY
jgi:cytochrome d ubiquinol oxidase subunit II